VAALWLAFTVYLDVSMAGYPDGHLTAYARAVDLPMRVVGWAAIATGACCLGLVLSPVSARVRVFGVLAAVVLLLALAVGASFGIPWYFGTHLGFDHGIGG
jgi:hypothetical protein